MGVRTVNFPLISITTFLPIAGSLAVLAFSSRRETARAVAMTVAVLSLGMVLAIAAGFDPARGDFQLEERHHWIPLLNVDYRVAVDGISLLFLLVTGLVVPMALMASWRVEEEAPLYFALILMLQSGLFGTFTALNFFHWFLFWELSLVPAFFLVRLWGGPERVATATQFFVYTMAGSVALLLAFLAIYWSTGQFDFTEIAGLSRSGGLTAALDPLGWKGLTARHWQIVIFALAFFGFAVKIPVVPFHTWLPPAYTEARTGTTMLLTGLMSKMGVYGLLRILLPIFPVEMQWLQTPLLWAAVVTIVYSAGAALAQRDMKRMLAYSSINHLGYCLLGVAAVVSATSLGSTPGAEKAAVLSGVLLQVFNHGITAAALFWFAGVLEERSGGLRNLEDFGGLRKVAPILCGFMGIALFSSLGLPGLNGFPGEFLIFKGAFSLAPAATVGAVLGLLLTAVFLLTLLQRVFYGPLHPGRTGFRDLGARECLIFTPVVGLMFLLGVYPQVLLRYLNGTVIHVVNQIGF